MRKLMIGLLVAATAMTPIAASAQDRGARPDRSGGFQARAERVERSDGGQRAQRPQRAERAQRQAPQAVQQQARVQQAQRQAHDRSRGGNSDRRALQQRIEATREASRQSAEGLAPRYQRQAAENQRRAEERMREQYRDNRRDNDRRDWRNDRNDDRRNWANNRRDDRRDWNRSWRNDNRYDWQRYRYSNRSRYQLSPYYAPYRGYNYSRFSIGLLIDPVFYGSRYWINDPYQYRLPPAPPGTRWVRYYDDVVLIDTYNGEVVDIIYDFFY